MRVLQEGFTTLHDTVLLFCLSYETFSKGKYEYFLFDYAVSEGNSDMFERYIASVF